MNRRIGRASGDLPARRASARAYGRAVALLAAVGLLLGSPPAAAEDDEILLGMSTALSGPAAELGENMKTGVLAALQETNRAGGIAGRSLRLVTLDDQYEPAQTVPKSVAPVTSISPAGASPETATVALGVSGSSLVIVRTPSSRPGEDGAKTIERVATSPGASTLRSIDTV